MKKTLALMFGISVVAGIGYLGWAYGGIGKIVLSKWMLKKWKNRADCQKLRFDVQKLEGELKKLEYEDHELLFRYTWIDPVAKASGGPLDPSIEKRVKKIVTKLRERNVFKRADLSPLNASSLFGS
jgi:hypothetical protein